MAFWNLIRPEQSFNALKSNKRFLFKLQKSILKKIFLLITIGLFVRTRPLKEKQNDPSRRFKDFFVLFVCLQR